MEAVTDNRIGKNKKKNKKAKVFAFLLTLIVIGVVGVNIYYRFIGNENDNKDNASGNYSSVNPSEIIIPEYTDSPYVEINGDVPFFTEEEKDTEAFEYYSELDSLGRCQFAYANVCPELMPTEPRGEIGEVKPTGWVQKKYEGLVDTDPPYLYNRCHLIAFCLAGENANEKNLITGTRYMNATGMLTWEERVARYVDDTGNHVLYRVTPDFRDEELVARGVLIEAYSVEDKGEGICFCVYCYNVQPGIEIDYLTGKNWLLVE